VSGPPAIQAALSPSPPASERGLSTHRIGAWVGLTAVLEELKKRNLLPLLGFEPWIIQPVA